MTLSISIASVLMFSTLANMIRAWSLLSPSTEPKHIAVAAASSKVEFVFAFENLDIWYNIDIAVLVTS